MTIKQVATEYVADEGETIKLKCDPPCACGRVNVWWHPHQIWKMEDEHLVYYAPTKGRVHGCGVMGCHHPVELHLSKLMTTLVKLRGTC